MRLYPECVRKGSKHHAARLTEESVLEIRERYRRGETQKKQLAEIYGVSEATIGRVVDRKLWKHV
jgi:hypothetical protein